MKEEIKIIPIDHIHILNPRAREKRKFELIVQSIRTLGLKKPIQVSVRESKESKGEGYDLVCGQGRIEAFKALGYTEIPAIVVAISKEERLLRSLVENMARRFATPADLMEEIIRLKTKGYSNVEVAGKLGVNYSFVSGLLSLKKTGEEHLLQAALSGKIPISIAMEIVRAGSADAQRSLLKGYEDKKLNWEAIRTVKRLMAHRRFVGKQRSRRGERLTSAESVVNAYRREGDRLKLMIRKAKLCNAKLTFVITAFSQLLEDENYTTLLRAELLFTMPKNLWTKVAANQKEAA